MKLDLYIYVSALSINSMLRHADLLYHIISGNSQAPLDMFKVSSDPFFFSRLSLYFVHEELIITLL